MRTAEELYLLYAKFDKDIATKSRWLRLAIVIDQFFNVLFYNGSQDETISSNIGRTGKSKWLCKILQKLEHNHCNKSLGE